MSNCAFNYSGSKSDYHELHAITEPVIDLFGGGGGWWSHVASEIIYVNDVNSELIRFQRVVYSSTDEQFETLITKLYEITSAVDSRESYEALRTRFNASKNPLLFMAVLSCCTNNMIRYNMSGGFNQTWGQRKFNKNMEKKLREFRERIHYKKIFFQSESFINYEKIDNALFLIDPPYIISGNTYGIWNEHHENSLYAWMKDVRFVMTNYIRRGALTNDILSNAITVNNWSTAELRVGKMRAQKDDSSFIELIVCDSAETLSMFNLL